MSDEAHVDLVMGWMDLGETAELRRNSTGFSTIKELAANAAREQPIKINAFFYASLCPAKNFDLFLEENVEAIKDGVAEIDKKMDLLENFEREAIPTGSGSLEKTYLAIRNVAARPNARDEQRTMAVFLFNGPSTIEQIASELGISANLAERVCRALKPALDETDDKAFVLKADTDVLAVVTYLVRITLGLDPMSVLKRRIEVRDMAAGTESKS